VCRPIEQLGQKLCLNKGPRLIKGYHEPATWASKRMFVHFGLRKLLRRRIHQQHCVIWK